MTIVTGIVTSYVLRLPHSDRKKSAVRFRLGLSIWECRGDQLAKVGCKGSTWKALGILWLRCASVFANTLECLALAQWPILSSQSWDKLIKIPLSPIYTRKYSQVLVASEVSMQVKLFSFLLGRVRTNSGCPSSNGWFTTRNEWHFVGSLWDSDVALRIFWNLLRRNGFLKKALAPGTWFISIYLSYFRELKFQEFQGCLSQKK